MTKKVKNTLKESALFLKHAIKSPMQVAYFMPSSPWLIDQVAKCAHLKDAKRIMELGPGTGGTTKGRVTPATQVDHIKPKADGGTDEHANLQSICTDCHKIKTAQDSGYTPKQQIGLDGWPTN